MKFNLRRVLCCASLAFFCIHAAAETVVVQRVIDGDTVELAGGEVVRFIGFNAPELARRDRAGNIKTKAEPYATAAKKLLAELVQGKRVKIIAGIDSSDRYGRTLAHIDLPDGTDVQVELLKRGLGFAVYWPPNVRRIGAHRAAEEVARAKKLGVWRLPYFAVRIAGEGNMSRGFRRVTGVVDAIKPQRNYIHITLNEKFTLLIQHRAWKDLWQDGGEKLLGKTVTARGWAYKRKRWQMSIRHPWMLQVQ